MLSPVLQQDIVVNLLPSFNTITDLTMYKAVILGLTDTGYERSINIMSYDDTAKSLTLRF